MKDYDNAFDYNVFPLPSPFSKSYYVNDDDSLNNVLSDLWTSPEHMKGILALGFVLLVTASVLLFVYGIHNIRFTKTRTMGTILLIFGFICALPIIIGFYNQLAPDKYKLL